MEAIFLQYTCDLAPSGRAACKKCGNPIQQYSARFCRKVRSPWHDGFDIQYNHLPCGSKWAKSLNEIHMLGTLRWKDLQRAADEWEYDGLCPSTTAASANAAPANTASASQAATSSQATASSQIKAYRHMVDSIHSVRLLLLESKIPVTTLTSILVHNGYDENIFHKMAPPMVAHVCADLLIRGLPPPCPLCETQALLPSGFAYYCSGWVAPTTRCEFWISANPFPNPLQNSVVRGRGSANAAIEKTQEIPHSVSPAAGSVKWFQVSKRERVLKIPEAFASLPIWRKLGGTLRAIAGNELAEYHTKDDKEFYKTKILSGKPVSLRKLDIQAQINDMKKLSRSDLMVGMYIAVHGKVEHLDKDSFQSAVKHYGGLFALDISKLATPPKPQWRSICIANASQWKKNASKPVSLLQGGAIILREEFIVALLAKDCDQITIDLPQTQAQPEPISELKGEVKGEGQNWPAGPKLRLAKFMSEFRLGGAKAFDVNTPTEDPPPQQCDTRAAAWPRIKRRSAIMLIDEHFPRDENSLGDYHLGVYTDPNNNVFHAKLSFVDLAQNKNSFYVLQIIEVSRVRKDLVNRKRGVDDDGSTSTKRSKQGGVNEAADSGFQKGEKAGLERGDPDAKRDKKYKNLSTSLPTADEQPISVAPANVSEWEALLYDSEYIDFASLPKSVKKEMKMVKIAKYFLLKSWGRQGGDEKLTNDSMMEEFSTDLEDCVKAFCTKFASLSGYSFFARHTAWQTQIPGRYQLVNLEGQALPAGSSSLSDSVHDPKAQTKAKNDKADGSTGKGANLPEWLTALLEVIYNQQMVELALQAMSIDSAQINNLLPEQILKGYLILSDIEAKLREREAGKLDELEVAKIVLKIKGLSSAYYSCIPRVLKTQKIIDSALLLKQECALLDSLRQSSVTARESRLSFSDLLPAMQVEIQPPLDQASEAYKLINDYMTYNHGVTHGFTLTVYGMYPLVPNNPPPQLPTPENLDHESAANSMGEEQFDSMLLWHGTRLANVGSILSHGIQIAPPEAPSSGYMFGKGLYFTDICSKAAQYSYCHENNETIILFLYEVVLGKPLVCFAADEKIAEKQAIGLDAEYQSVKGEGKLVPEVDPEKIATLTLTPEGRKVRVPVGKQTKNPDYPAKKLALTFNEYIVYHPEQVKPKFLIRARLNFKCFTE